MATISAVSGPIENGVIQTIWTPFAISADVGTAQQLSHYPLHAVQFIGTYTGSILFVLEGSNDGVVYRPLYGQNETGVFAAISGVGADVLFTMTNMVVRHIRPRATAGTGGASVKVVITSAAIRT